jgi:UDP:flavonoid glycosyltransferase YjiC (YdhE family)
MTDFRRRRVLFFAEAVTLAHLTRPLTLARALDANRFEIHFACAPGKDVFFNEVNFQRWPIFSIKDETFLRALSNGRPLYDLGTLTRYVEDDRQLLEKLKPDVVIGDFRLSLAVSAPLCKVPYVAIANAHWSPYTTLKEFPLPNIPLTRWLGVNLGTKLFHLVQPLAFAYHARPLNKLRRRYGFPPMQSLLETYTYGDYTLYADVPNLVPTDKLPTNHHYIGPIFWSPQIDLPSWWSTLNHGDTIIYVTLGSSGQVELLPIIVEALKHLPVKVLLATAGRINVENLSKNFYAADYLPGEEVSKRSRLLICNGGSATAYQGIKAGVPVIGIPSNMDQFLTMTAINHNKAGILLRPERLSSENIRCAVTGILESAEYYDGAKKIAAQIADYDATSNFRLFIDQLLASAEISKTMK